jgi:hypothetical protein
MAPLRGAKRRKKAAAEKKAAMAAAAGQGAPGGDWWDGFCMRMAGASLSAPRARTSPRDLRRFCVTRGHILAWRRYFFLDLNYCISHAPIPGVVVSWFVDRVRSYS